MIIGGIVAGSGSSPLARGTYQANTTAPVVARFIPARAGNPLRPSVRVRCRWAHLRSRGEHWTPFFADQISFGSSPLARGTRCRRGSWCGAWRLIPARAGNTMADRATGRHDPAHPRSRGEHVATGRAAVSVPGSSPLARGTHTVVVAEVGGVGLIPARAGNTTPVSVGACRRTAHPRSRGEHGIPAMKPPEEYGSSPLARGTRLRCRVLLLCRRLIPARAGNTDNPKAAAAYRAAHPRSRGEHQALSSSSRRFRGSSPLARGTREH